MIAHLLLARTEKNSNATSNKHDFDCTARTRIHTGLTILTRLSASLSEIMEVYTFDGGSAGLVCVLVCGCGIVCRRLQKRDFTAFVSLTCVRVRVFVSDCSVKWL